VSAKRELYRIIDARIDQKLRDSTPEYVRGTVASITPNLRVLTASLDGTSIPTPGITYPAGIVPVVGDDVIVMRKRNGFLLVLAILGRD